MKERSFYVINLDNKRLFVVGLTSLAIMGGFFSFGFRLGTQQSPKPNLLSGAQPTSQVQLKGNPVESSYPEPAATNKTPQYETIDLSAPSKAPAPAPGPDSQAGMAQTPTANNAAGKKPNYSQNDPNPMVPGPSKSSKIDTNSPVSADAPKAVTKAPKSKSVGKYTVQIAAFKTRKRAKKAKLKLKKKGLGSYIVKGSNYFFVRAGKANSKGALKKKKAKIKKRTGYEPIIIKSKL